MWNGVPVVAQRSRDREEEARNEDARRASREATEEHGKPTIYKNSGESQMEVTPE